MSESECQCCSFMKIAMKKINLVWLVVHHGSIIPRVNNSLFWSPNIWWAGQFSHSWIHRLCSNFLKQFCNYAVSPVSCYRKLSWEMWGLQATLMDNWGQLAVAVMCFDWRFNVVLHPRGGCRLSTICKGCNARAGIWCYWSVRKAECANGCVQVLPWDRSAGSNQPVQAPPVTLCIFDMQKQIHWFFNEVLWFRLCSVEEEMPSEAGVVFKDEEMGIGLQKEELLFSYWMGAERKR